MNRVVTFGNDELPEVVEVADKGGDVLDEELVDVAASDDSGAAALPVGVIVIEGEDAAAALEPPDELPPASLT